MMTSTELVLSCKQFSTAKYYALGILLYQSQKRLRPVHQLAKLELFVRQIKSALLAIQLAKVMLKVCIQAPDGVIFIALQTQTILQIALSWMFTSNPQELPLLQPNNQLL